MTRKDDPVFNVKFVQLVENHPCLWNSTLPAYSKKEEIQKAWQEVANETKDTVRNCRERWRTIRSSFLRSLKISRTNTGRGKRKYYLSKYLQFLIPYTKTRLKNGNSANPIRKLVPLPPPMTRISNMPFPAQSSDDTKDSSTSEIAIAEEDVVVSLHEGLQQHQQQQQQPHRLVAIKTEPNATNSVTEANRRAPTTCSTSSNIATTNATNGVLAEQQTVQAMQLTPRTSSVVDLTEFAEWIKCKNEHQRHCLMPTSPDADQSFLNSLHPFLKEMSGKQNRRFRQKVVALIDAILENTD